MNAVKTSIVLSTLLLSVAATTAMAANPNGPKPKCPLGQILVVENNQYQCKQPSLKAPTSAEQRATSSSTPVKLKKVKIKLPDLKVISAKLKPGTTDTFIVAVRNFGNATAGANVLWGTHYVGNNAWGGAVNFPALQPGKQKKVEVQIAPSNNYSAGDKVVFEADQQKQIVESNEKNNKYSYRYPKK